MSQSAEKVLDHMTLFRQPEYTDMFESKKTCFEDGHSDAKVQEIADWTKSWDYREKNFAREALVINPAKACQPLGAIFAAVGFEGTLPFVHGSQGCVSYFRSHFNRHFKEPSSAVSSSMTEDAAVFGGLNNMVDGLANSYSLYKPKMIAVCTTCMAEVIGDDLDSFIKTSKQKGSIPEEFDVPFAHTPSFVGSHITGYDNMMKGVLTHFWEKTERKENAKINFVGGFDGYTVGNLREVKRMFDLMGLGYTILGDNSDVFDTPTDGEFRMYDGGTPLAAAKDALNAKGTVFMQQYGSEKTAEYVKSKGQEALVFNHPVGVTATDEFLMAISKLTGKAIPAALEMERGRLLDAMADSQAYLHGKKFAIYGDPSLCMGLTAFLLEMGAEPVHVLATNGNKDWVANMQALLDASPFGQGCKAWGGKDLWHMRSLLATEPVDFLIGNTYGKFLERDIGTPLIRIGFPVFDRHHHHRYPVWGYQGSLNVLVKILDKIFDEMDKSTNVAGKTDYSYDIIR
jgi:nitrogenase molybdenum-iron protein beta chain